MKQNEKILVYAVTGFLVVILMVAVVFGKGESPALPEPGEIGAAPSLEELLDRKSEGAKVDAGADAAKVPDPVVGDRPLAANVQLLPPTPAAVVAEKLGVSQREHGFRIVRARAGDTLSGLVQKWCGSVEDHLESARAYNEELSTLRVGQEVVLPWVDDEVILAAHEAKAAAGGPAPAGPQPATAPALQGVVPAAVADGRGGAAPADAAAAGAARKHVIKAGESLWKIAEREVGRGGAPEYLRKLRELNPGLEAERLKIGQEILLPPRS
jgi:hypothetical protein